MPNDCTVMKIEVNKRRLFNACSLALVQGIGGMLATRHGSSTLILERE